uniref:nucleoside-diphosphate kinase n=1 Tax=Erpetoichthys calabaricus TaxID=27687 RepID=A0A8C4XG76_ERPCA
MVALIRIAIESCCLIDTEVFGCFDSLASLVRLPLISMPWSEPKTACSLWSSQTGLMDEIIKRFEQNGFCLVEHDYMHPGLVLAMVMEGLNVVKNGSHPGTIRGDFCIQVGRNSIYGSGLVESANKEMSLGWTRLFGKDFFKSCETRILP